MKNRKLPSFIALSISLELVLSPLPAMADTKNKQSLGESLMQGLNTAQGLYNQFRGQPQGGTPSHVAIDMQAFQAQQTPAPDKHFTTQNLSKIPGLMEYIAKKNQGAAATGGKPINPNSLNCNTLPATLTVADNQVCRDGRVSNLNGPQAARAQAEEAFAYYNQYSQIEKLYNNYQASSNVGGQSFGPTCMNDAMEILKGFFAYRIEQMDTMVAEFEAASAKFQEQSEMDLKSIRESTAILNGESSKFATEFKNTNIFDYGERFKDPACNSMLSKDDMDKLGKEGGGLLAIDKRLKADMGTTPPGSKYNAEQYLKKNADITNEIRKMANDVSKQAQLNFSSIANSQEGYSAFLGQIGGSVNTESGAHQGLNKAFFADLQTKFSESRKKLTDDMKVIQSELGNRGGEALSMLSDVDNDSSFDAELTSLENQIKGECLSRSGVDTALSRIHDPNLSKEANKHTSAQIRKRIKAIIDDIKLSPERKLQELQAIEASTGSRYEMKMDANYEINELNSDGTVKKKTVNAATKVTPGSYFSDVIKNCETQFQVNKLNNKMSAKETIKKLRTLKKDYQKAAKQHSKDIKDEIVKKMIDCGGNTETQASTTVASCSPAKLDMSSPGFCTKAAFSCSKNMQQCSQKAANFVKQIKDDRLKRTNNYNNNVEANRKQLVAMFDTAMSKFMKEAESLRGMFGAGFKAPSGIERDIKDDSKFDPKFLSNQGDALEIKDPKQYLEMIKGNMTKLRAEVDAQQKQIMGRDGALAEHIKKTEENYKAVARESGDLKGRCLAAYDGYNKGVEDAKMANDKAMGELGEKNGELCGLYSDIMGDNPDGSCKEDIRSLANSAMSASKRAGQMNDGQINQMVSEMKARCNGVGSELKDANEVCINVANNDKLNEIFIERYRGAGRGGSLATACNQLGGEAPKDGENVFCTASPDEKVEEVLTKEEAESNVNADPAKYHSCKSWKLIEEKSNKYSGKCTPKTQDCKNLEDQIVAVYNYARNNGELNEPSTQSNSMPTLCRSSNNAGPFNTKGGFPNMQNPLAGQPMGAGAGWQ